MADGAHKRNPSSSSSSSRGQKAWVPRGPGRERSSESQEDGPRSSPHSVGSKKSPMQTVTPVQPPKSADSLPQVVTPVQSPKSADSPWQMVTPVGPQKSVDSPLQMVKPVEPPKSVDLAPQVVTSVQLQESLDLALQFGALFQPSKSSDLRSTSCGSGAVVSDSRASPFDICMGDSKCSAGVKPSLLEINREKWRARELSNSAAAFQHLRPGMVLLKNFLKPDDQVKIIKQCRELGVGAGGFYQPGYKDGTKLSRKMMCLGKKNWEPDPCSYIDIRSFDGAQPPKIPEELTKFVKDAIDASHALLKQNGQGTSNPSKEIPPMSPDICIVNFYTTAGKLGLHQDKSETKDSLAKGLPVVSFSLGDTAEFLYGDARDETKASKVKLESGDVLIFGGQSRHIFHGVSSITPKTAPIYVTDGANLRPGRLNLTFRQYQLQESLDLALQFGALFQPSKSSDSRSTSCGSGAVVSDSRASPFDICMGDSKCSAGVKPSLLEINREKRRARELSNSAAAFQHLRPGMVLLKNFLKPDDQVKIIKQCRDLGIGTGGFYQPSYRDGAKLSLRMMCLRKKNWDPDSCYGDIRPFDGAQPLKIPEELTKFVNDAIEASHAFLKQSVQGASNPKKQIPPMSPDICIVNFYTTAGKLGLHQDKDETIDSLDKKLPVVSFSLGDTAEFLYGDTRDETKASKVKLESGDVLIFGGQSRHIFHGVSSITPKTAPTYVTKEANLRPGRLNLTFRQY